MARDLLASVELPTAATLAGSVNNEANTLSSRNSQVQNYHQSNLLTRCDCGGGGPL